MNTKLLISSQEYVRRKSLIPMFTNIFSEVVLLQELLSMLISYIAFGIQKYEMENILYRMCTTRRYQVITTAVTFSPLLLIEKCTTFKRIEYIVCLCRFVWLLYLLKFYAPGLGIHMSVSIRGVHIAFHVCSGCPYHNTMGSNGRPSTSDRRVLSDALRLSS